MNFPRPVLFYNLPMNIRAGAERLQRRVAALVRRFDPVGGDTAIPTLEPGGSLATVHQTRESIASSFLRGDGIEIGALHQPLHLPTAARVKYVDRMTAAELRRHYEELAAFTLVETDIIDDGEQLPTIQDATQDFVIANHFIEHCQNPILTFQNLFRVTRPGGILYLAVPDKRFTFDVDRPCTTIEHIMKDFTEGPEWSRRQHFEEWTRLVNKCSDEAQVAAEVQHLMDIDYSIHFHVWTATELLELVETVRRVVSFELEVFLRNGFETLLILRKPAT
jgi:SAM-dependent methyltransferase